MKKMDSKGQGAMEYLMTYGWAIMVVMIVGVVLWQMGIFKMGSGGTGMSGFGAVKPLDHTSTGAGNLDLTLTNGVGARINNMVIISSDGIGGPANLIPDATAAGGSSISPGDTVLAQLTGVTTVCPAGADTYDVSVNVSYSNVITGLNHSGNGRVWGPC